MEETPAIGGDGCQFDVASKGFQVIEVKVIERELNAGDNQYGFQDKVFIEIEPSR